MKHWQLCLWQFRNLWNQWQICAMSKCTRPFRPSALQPLIRTSVARAFCYYHKACLIFLSCVRGLPHYRWLSALDLVALSVSPALSPAVSTYSRTYTHDTVGRERVGNKREKEGGGGEHCASIEDTVPTKEAHRASVPSLQLRALIRLIVSNIETHNKHNTWRPFAILISPSQLAWTTQLQPSGISLIWLQNNDTIIAMATLLLHPMSTSTGRILIHRSALKTKWITRRLARYQVNECATQATPPV